MFDSQTIEQIASDDLQQCAKDGLKLLAVSGFLQLTLDHISQRVLVGNPDQSADELAAEILRFRRDRAILLELIELGQRFTKEQTR